MNKVILIGRLGADPEINYTAKKKPICSFSVATSDGPTDENGKVQPQWHKIVAWDTVAENCAKYLLKGRQVCIEGRLKNEEWLDKNQNKKRRTIVSASRVMFLDTTRREYQDVNGETKEDSSTELDLDF